MTGRQYWRGYFGTRGLRRAILNQSDEQVTAQNRVRTLLAGVRLDAMPTVPQSIDQSIALHHLSWTTSIDVSKLQISFSSGINARHELPLVAQRLKLRCLACRMIWHKGYCCSFAFDTLALLENQYTTLIILNPLQTTELSMKLLRNIYFGASRFDSLAKIICWVQFRTPVLRLHDIVVIQCPKATRSSSRHYALVLSQQAGGINPVTNLISLQSSLDKNKLYTYNTIYFLISLSNTTGPPRFFLKISGTKQTCAPVL